MPDADHRQPPASPWVRRFLRVIPADGRCLDVAAGGGRHTRLLLTHGHPVTAVDRDISGLADLAEDPRLTRLCADLENAPWPLPGQHYPAVVVTNYCWRPLMADLIRAVAAGGCLIYDTFARGQAAYGHPRNPQFLLQPDELLEAVRGQLQVLAYEHGLVHEPAPAMRSRICALRPAALD